MIQTCCGVCKTNSKSNAKLCDGGCGGERPPQKRKTIHKPYQFVSKIINHQCGVKENESQKLDKSPLSLAFSSKSPKIIPTHRKNHGVTCLLWRLRSKGQKQGDALRRENAPIYPLMRIGKIGRIGRGVSMIQFSRPLYIGSG